MTREKYTSNSAGGFITEQLQHDRGDLILDRSEPGRRGVFPPAMLVKALVIGAIPPVRPAGIGPTSCVRLRQTIENQAEEKYADGNDVPQSYGEAERLCMKRYMLDDSNTFGGAHYVNPRQIYGGALSIPLLKR
jgi:hypothetical protein